jgi:hypothetical protein
VESRAQGQQNGGKRQFGPLQRAERGQHLMLLFKTYFDKFGLSSGMFDPCVQNSKQLK